MSIITFNWDKHFLYAIIYWVLEISVRLVMYEKWLWFKMSDSDVQNEYIYVVLLTISDLLAAFLVLYIKCSFKKEQKKLKKADTDVELIYEPGANEINNSKNLQYFKNWRIGIELSFEIQKYNNIKMNISYFK